MAMANKVVRCVASFSRTLLSPAATLQRGSTAQLCRRFISSRGKDEEASSIKVHVKNRRMDVSNFMNKTGVKPVEVHVRNGLMADVMTSASTGILKQTTIMDRGSRPICLDMQAATATDPVMLDAMLPTYTGLYENAPSGTHAYGREREKAHVSTMTANNEIAVIQLMEESRELCRKKDVFLHTDDKQSVVNIPVDVGKWNIDLMSVSGPKVYGPKCIRACYIRHRPKVGVHPLISGSGLECGLRSRTHANSWVIAFAEPCRISQEAIEYTCTSKSFFPQSSICSSTMQDGNYLHKRYHKKQPKQFTRALQTMSYGKADTKKKKSMANTNEDQKTDKKRRNQKWTTSYSKITIREAENLLGIRLNLLGIPVRQMLEGKHVLLGSDTVLKLKKEIYQGLVNYIQAEGYPTEADADFKEANINDIVAFTIVPIIAQLNRETKWKLHLAREKEITSKDSSTSGMEEFVVMDYISHNKTKYVLVAEAKKVSLGEARKQCFLSLRDMWDHNGGGTVYGFVTMGDSWRMVSFDGTFQMSRKIELLFDDMDGKEEEWMANYSILIDCLNVALSHGGKDLVEVV